MTAKLQLRSASADPRPSATPAPYTVRTDRAAGSPDARSKARLLFIDDHFGESPGLRRLLQEQGFLVDVMTGVSFPVAARTFDDYQAVIVDVAAPQSNGFDGLRHIRKATGLPLLVLTARDADAGRTAVLELGADDHVVKPCRPREVVARIRALLRRRPAY